MQRPEAMLSSTLKRTHPTEERKLGALETFGSAVLTKRSQSTDDQETDTEVASEIAELLKEIGGRQEARTPDLGVANGSKRKR